MAKTFEQIVREATAMVSRYPTERFTWGTIRGCAIVALAADGQHGPDVDLVARVEKAVRDELVRGADAASANSSPLPSVYSLERFDALPIGWHRLAVVMFGEGAEKALDALVALYGPCVDWPGLDAARAMLVLAYPHERVSILPAAPVHFCDGESCPGLPYRASEVGHPSWHAIPAVTQPGKERG